MKIKNLMIGSIFIFLNLYAQFGQAATITVTTTDDTVNGDADCSLREAIANANDNAQTYAGCAAGVSGADTIVLAADTYCLSLTGAEENAGLAGDLDIAESLTIEGQGSTQTIIDAGSSADSVGAGCSTELNERLFHVVIDDSSVAGVTVDSATLTFSGLTLRGGKSTHATYNRHGGALYMSTSNSTLNLSDVVFKDNSAIGTDGDIFGGAASLGNTTTIDFTNVTLDGNSATSTNGVALGGGFYMDHVSGTMTGLLAKDNTTSSGTGLQQNGGALYIGQITDITITNATFTNNSANSDPTASGGAIYLLGGGSPEPSLTIQSADFTDNTATLYGGGVYFSSNTAVTVQNTVFNGNTATTGGSSCYGTIDSGTNNFADDSNDCAFAETPTATAPLLGTLLDNGGFLATMAIDDTSPLLDAGDCSSYTVTEDQRGTGFDRSIGLACDVGAYELQEHTDVDEDGYFLYAANEAHLDCDDSDAAINPAATEIPGNAVDENCDTVADPAETGTDSGTDTSTDSGSDTSTDSGTDAGTDSGADSGADTGGTDEGETTGSEATSSSSSGGCQLVAGEVGNPAGLIAALGFLTTLIVARKRTT